MANALGSHLSCTFQRAALQHLQKTNVFDSNRQRNTTLLQALCRPCRRGNTNQQKNTEVLECPDVQKYVSGF